MFYKYKVTYWDIHDTEESIDEGLVYAKNYGKAAMKVVDEYGENCIIDIYLTELDNVNCINKDDIDFSFREN
jgi:hypothetical protein